MNIHSHWHTTNGIRATLQHPGGHGGGADWDPYPGPFNNSYRTTHESRFTMTKDLKRDSKGRFASPNSTDDSPTGKKPDEDLIELAEAVAAGLMKSRDQKNRATGAKLVLAVKTFKKQNPEKDNMQVLAPEVLDVVGWYLTKDARTYGENGSKAETDPTTGLLKDLAQKHGVSAEDLMKAMGTVCPGCRKLSEELKRKEPAS